MVLYDFDFAPEHPKQNLSTSMFNLKPRFCPLYVRGYLHMYLLCMWMWLANTWCQRVNVLEPKAEHCRIPGCYIVDVKTSVSLGYNNLFVSGNLCVFFLG